MFTIFLNHLSTHPSLSTHSSTHPSTLSVDSCMPDSVLQDKDVAVSKAYLVSFQGSFSPTGRGANMKQVISMKSAVREKVQVLRQC
jgi:hypothetical protein